jgi:hypothetical protein
MLRHVNLLLVPLLFYFNRKFFKHRIYVCYIGPTIQVVSFFLVSWGGVRLSPLGMSATNWPIVPAPDDR